MPGFVPNEAPKMFGVYVKNVSTSIGWGGQGGSCQMTLVEQPNEGIQILRPVFQGDFLLVASYNDIPTKNLFQNLRLILS